MHKSRIVLISVGICSILLLIGYPVSSQTCCTGSAPITGSIRISSIDTKQWNLNIIADHNYISDLFIEEEEIEEDLIIRSTNTLLFQTNYGFTDRISASIVLPFVNKWEQVNSARSSRSAIGDLSILLQYSVLNNESISVIIGSGVKFPTGPTQLKNEQTGIIIQPSLQPGTGSYDYLFLSQIQHSFPFRRSMSIAQSFSYQIAGTSEQFASHQSYSFGNEFQSFTSLADQYVWLNKIFTPSITIRLSHRTTNTIENFEDINSGGIWVYLSPGTTIQLNSQIGVLFQGDIPIYRKVNGFQLVPSYILRGGLLISI